jgi:hypothetical protein
MTNGVYFLDVSERPLGDSEQAHSIMSALGELRAVDFEGCARWVVEYMVYGTEEPSEAIMISRVENELEAIDDDWNTHLQVNGISKR